MSCEEWTENGYGLAAEAELGTDYIDLVKKLAEDVPADCKEVFTSRYDKKMFLKELDKCDSSKNKGSGYSTYENLLELFDYFPLKFLADFLNWKYDCVGFEAPSEDEDDTVALLYLPLYPWEGKEGDRSMTKEKIDKIFSDAAKALGWSGQDAVPDRQELHYFS